MNKTEIIILLYSEKGCCEVHLDRPLKCEEVNDFQHEGRSYYLVGADIRESYSELRAFLDFYERGMYHPDRPDMFKLQERPENV